jgi:small subunit ribosomal protein S6
MREYELVVLLHPDLELNLDNPLKKVTDIVTSSGGKVINQDIWGKRKLAYPIAKENFAVYVYFDIQLPPEAMAKAEGLFNITDEVIRYLITTPVPVDEDEDELAEEESNEQEEKDDKEDKKPKDTKSTKDEKEK